MEHTEHVLLTELASEFSLDRSNTRKWVRRQGIEPLRVRTQRSGGQVELAVKTDEANLLRQARQQQGFIVGESPNAALSTSDGYFYAIQLIPELDDRRIKFGFATNSQARLMAHRTTCPRAVILREWPCRFAWESTAIACATRIDCALLSNEVYVCLDVEHMLERMDVFFASLPSPDFRPPTHD